MVALTIATMPARTASGSASQRPTSNAKSGDFSYNGAKRDAKHSVSSPEVLGLSMLTRAEQRVLKTARANYPRGFESPPSAQP
jgi:hypothetical protein